jgi:FkbM family methyltransferase
MKKITRLVHTLIKWFHIDDIAARYSFIAFIRKFVPEPFEYKRPTFKYVKRNGVNFQLDVSDFMQWSVYACLPDASYKYAFNSLKRYADPVLVLDIGANVGAFSLALAHQCRESKLRNFYIYAFEPNPSIFNIFKTNTTINSGLSNFISLESYALGNSIGEANFTYSSKNSGNGHIVDGVDRLGFKVSMTTCDAFLASINQEQVAFIKIDVEGFEPFVLDGGLNTVKRWKPDLYIEITPSWFEKRGRLASLLVQDLLNIGYSIYIDNDGNLTPYDCFSKNLSWQFNILATCRPEFL